MHKHLLWRYLFCDKPDARGVTSTKRARTAKKKWGSQLDVPNAPTGGGHRTTSGKWMSVPLPVRCASGSLVQGIQLMNTLDWEGLYTSRKRDVAPLVPASVRRVCQKSQTSMKTGATHWTAPIGASERTHRISNSMQRALVQGQALVGRKYRLRVNA